MIHTTFRKAKEAGACFESYKKMAEALGGDMSYGMDTTIGLDKVLEVCGLHDALWALRITIEPIEREARLFACACAERVLPLFEAKSPNDKRPRQAIEIARQFAAGEATGAELATAGDAARAAEAAARVAGTAGAARAAWAASAARAADATWDAARAAGTAARAAGAAEEKWQEEAFLKLIKGG